MWRAFSVGGPAEAAIGPAGVATGWAAAVEPRGFN
jgi:hypothetical protein